jgi:hypothetical protein
MNLMRFWSDLSMWNRYSLRSSPCYCSNVANSPKRDPWLAPPVACA